MNYGLFAQVYDELMDDSLYLKWIEYTNGYLSGNGNLLELGCGSGRLAIQLKQAGYNPTGLDQSNDMLSLAYDYQQDSGTSFPLLERDMRDLSGLGAYDAVISYCDSLCYLGKKKDVERVFSQVFHILNDGGIFLFDVHSIYQMNHFIDFSFHAEWDDLVFLWDSQEGEEDYSIEHKLTFLRKKNEAYYRSEELHKERTYPIEDYRIMLEQAGFSKIEITADFGQEVNDTSKRWFFKAEK